MQKLTQPGLVLRGPEVKPYATSVLFGIVGKQALYEGEKEVAHPVNGLDTPYWSTEIRGWIYPDHATWAIAGTLTFDRISELKQLQETAKYATQLQRKYDKLRDESPLYQACSDDRSRNAAFAHNISLWARAIGGLWARSLEYTDRAYDVGTWTYLKDPVSIRSKLSVYYSHYISPLYPN